MLGSAKRKMEEEKKKKKAWTTPTLTPIVRRKPEEGILNGCKTEATAGPDGVAMCVQGKDRLDFCYEWGSS